MDPVRAILREDESAMTTANILEVFDVSSRRYEVPPPRVARIVDPLFRRKIRAIPLDIAIALWAAEIRGRHYHRSSCPLSLADAILLASARPGDRIATADRAVLDTANVIGIEVLELPIQG
jgi:predicted nucleic acid-binding protein